MEHIIFKTVLIYKISILLFNVEEGIVFLGVQTE